MYTTSICLRKSMSDLINFTDVDISPVPGAGGAMLLNPKVGFELGWDYAMYGMTRDGLQPVSFQRGHDAGREHAGRNTLKNDPYARKWLQVRYNAWIRGRAVDEAVTPEFLAQIDCPRCPVTRLALTKGQMAETDWSIDRLNNDGAYAVGNLAVMSVKANQAKGGKSFAEIMDCAQAADEVDGLSPVEWLRMAVMCVATCSGDGEVVVVPILPLVVPPRPYVPVHPSQQAQLVLARQALGGKGTILHRMRGVAGSEADRKLFQKLVKRLRRCNSPAAPIAVWEDPRTFEIFREWYLSLSPKQLGTLVDVMGNHGGFGDMPVGFRDAWRLPSRGYA